MLQFRGARERWIGAGICTVERLGRAAARASLQPLFEGDAVMMKISLALSTAIVLSAGGAAFAQQQLPDPAIEGTIQSVDPGTNTMVLDDGQSYRLGEGVALDTIGEGSHVTLSCDDTGANCMVMSAGTTGESGPEAQSPEEQAKPSAGPAPGPGKSELPGLDQGKGGGGTSPTPADTGSTVNRAPADGTGDATNDAGSAANAPGSAAPQP
jgi:Protein of unknown function (DUF1344)